MVNGPSPSPGTPGEGRGEGSSNVETTTTAKRPGNGHGPRIDPDTAQPFDYEGGTAGPSTVPVADQDSGSLSTEGHANLRLAIVADPLSQQGSNMQADAPACDVCGSITVRSGTCYKCLNCGNSMGCS